MDRDLQKRDSIDGGSANKQASAPGLDALRQETPFSGFVKSRKILKSRLEGVIAPFIAPFLCDLRSRSPVAVRRIRRTWFPVGQKAS